MRRRLGFWRGSLHSVWTVSDERAQPQPFGCKITWLNVLIPKGQLPNGDRKGRHIVRLAFFNSSRIESEWKRIMYKYCSTWNLSAKISQPFRDTYLLSSILQYLEVGSVLVRGRNLTVSISKFIFCEKINALVSLANTFEGVSSMQLLSVVLGEDMPTFGRIFLPTPVTNLRVRMCLTHTGTSFQPPTYHHIAIQNVLKQESMDCKICELKQRQFLCESCLRTQYATRLGRPRHELTKLAAFMICVSNHSIMAQIATIT